VRRQADYRMEFVAVQRTGRIWICFMLSGLAGCGVEKPAYQPYYVVVPYTPGTDAKTSEEAARQVIERLRRQEANEAPAPANEAPAPAATVQSVPYADPVPFTDLPEQDPNTR